MIKTSQLKFNSVNIPFSYLFVELMQNITSEHRSVFFVMHFLIDGSEKYVGLISDKRREV